MDNVVIFDGVCKLCARSIKFILAHESKPALRFTPLQSPSGRRLMRECGLDVEDAKTFVLLANGKTYTKSDAAIQLARFLGGGWQLLGAVRLIPRPIRDWGYDFLARNRYRWFGRHDVCMIPTPELKARFIEE